MNLSLFNPALSPQLDGTTLLYWYWLNKNKGYVKQPTVLPSRQAPFF